MQNRGFLVFDSAFSCIIAVLMVILAMNFSNTFIRDSDEKMENEILLLRLYSISDYIIRDFSIDNSKYSKITNMIDLQKLELLDQEKLEKKIGLFGLYIGFEQKEKTCIYRIVLIDKEIRKIYFCADKYEKY